MALEFAHGNIRWLLADGVSTVYTVSGLPFQPKALRFYWMGLGNTTDGSSETLNAKRGVGFATGTADRRCVGSTDLDNVATTFCVAGFREDCVALTLSSAGTLEGLLDLNSITSDGFTLIVDDQGAIDLQIFWEAWGGDDITVAQTLSIAEPAATGNVDYTVTGFTAGATDQVVMFAGVQTTAAAPAAARADSTLCVGFAGGTAAADNVVAVGGSDDASGSTDTDRYALDGECLAMLTVGGGNPSARATLTQWNANGFRLNWLARATTDRRSIALAIKGGQWKVGSYTINAGSASATATVSGLAFAPKGLSLVTAFTTEHAAGTASAEDQMGLGSASSTSSRRAMGHWSENATASSNAEVNLAIEYDQVLVLPTNAGAVLTSHDVNAFNSDGFQIIVDTAGGAANEWHGYLAFGDAPTVIPPKPTVVLQAAARAASY